MEKTTTVTMPILLTTEMRKAFVTEIEAAKARHNGPHVTADAVYAKVVSVATGIPVEEIYELWK